MNIIIIVLLIALAALWWFSKSFKANLKVPMIALAVLAIAAFLFTVFTRESSRALPADLEKIEREAGFTLGQQMKALPDGPILILKWSGGGYNPDPTRLKGIQKAIGNGHPLIMGGAYVEGMKVDDHFVKLNPLNPDTDLRAYLEKNKDLTAVVVLRPIRNWEALEGLQSPPFYIFTTDDEWNRSNKNLVKAAMVGNSRVRDTKKQPPSNNFSNTEYRLETSR